jgi:hypothetical protein
MKEKGILFNAIEYQSIDDYEAFVEKMDGHQSEYIIRLALELANSNGIYTLEECEVISKSLRVITDDRKRENIKNSTD